MSDDFKPLNRHQPLDRHERNLPHWEQKGCTYFITWRTIDSIPNEVSNAWKNERDLFYQNNPLPWDEATQQTYHRQFTRRMEEWLDTGRGACVLRDPALREITCECLHHFHQQRYFLNSWVIMPNHVHVLVRPAENWSLSRILHTWKSFTATQINRKLNTSGVFWMDESFDHIVRSRHHLEHFRRYIQANPVKAGLRPTEYSLWMGDEK